jgi:hypothetical protein
MKFRPFFQEIVTTEVNGAMAKRLRERGFPCVQTPQVLPSSFFLFSFFSFLFSFFSLRYSPLMVR